MESLFKEGGPHKIWRTGPDEYSMRISIPKDVHGFIARECPSETCSPGYFKVKLGTGITEGQENAYCPYCRHCADPNDFTTKEQVRYAQDRVLTETSEGVGRVLRDALGLGLSGRKKFRGDFLSVEMSYKPGSLPYVRRPVEEELRRDIVCPNCGLDQSVFGLATWCSDCGKDIFLTHVEAELSVVELIISDVERRREQFGNRVAAKDIENCLEDTVSIFEAVMRALVIRHFKRNGMSDEEIQLLFKKEIRNGFQSIRRCEEIFRKELKIELFDGLSADEIQRLSETFEKRHPITHNLGVVDRKYLERSRTVNKEGREILVTTEEIKGAISLSFKVFKLLHDRLFGE